MKVRLSKTVELTVNEPKIKYTIEYQKNSFIFFDTFWYYVTTFFVSGHVSEEKAQQQAEDYFAMFIKNKGNIKHTHILKETTI